MRTQHSDAGPIYKHDTCKEHALWPDLQKKRNPRQSRKGGTTRNQMQRQDQRMRML